MKKLVVLLMLLGLVMGVGWRGVRADELDDINKQINELTQAREQSVAATKPLEGELFKLEEKLDGIEAGILKAKAELRALEASILKREKEFGEQYVLLAERALSFYKSSRIPSSLFVIFANGPGGNMTRNLFYQQAVTDRDKDEIAEITADLVQLERDKKKSEEDKVRLADIQVKLDKEADFFRGEIAGAKKYQAELSSQIATLNAKQQSIISQRQASLNLPQSLGAGTMACVDDRDDKYNPGFSNAYAFFTYGIPHRVGMNQYGAFGRAKDEQSHEDILRAYFTDFNFEDKGNIEIEVEGHGRMPIETYLLGIYEMPGDWPSEALKAQAIAARSYALSYTNSGSKSICTTQACQVYKGGNKGGKWEKAVKDTAGKTMISGGQPVTAWYSSTDGGYTFGNEQVWGGSHRSWTKNTRDTTGDVGSFSDLNEKSYDKDSPCFYAAQGSRDKYNKSAWLKGEEVADIVNALMLAKADSGVADHLYQTDKPHPYGGEVWDEDKVKDELRDRGITPYNNVTGVSVSADFGSGKTTNVSVSGDGGSKSFSGSELKSYFNLRAPASIQIVGPLYNVEKR